MTTIDDLARVERELRFFFSEGSSEILRAWADTIAAFVREQREREENMLALAEAVNQRIAAGGWRPIETAPCDGSTILLFCHNGGKHYSIHTGYFDCNEDDEGFRTEGDQCIPTNQECFLSWMLLPPPPTTTSGAEKESPNG